MEPLCTAGGNVKGCSYSGRKCGDSLQVNTELPSNPTSPFPTTQPKEPTAALSQFWPTYTHSGKVHRSEEVDASRDGLTDKPSVA